MSRSATPQRFVVAVSLIALAALAACGKKNPSGPGGPGATGPAETGTTWTPATAATGTNKWWGVSYGNNVFVTVGTGFRATSPTGETWASSAAPTDFTLQTAIGFANGKFVATSARGVSTSTDGVVWTDQLLASVATPSGADAQSLVAVTHGNGIWVMVDDRIVSQDVHAIFVSSDNGATWTHRLTGLPYAAAEPKGIGYGNGVYIMVGYRGLVATSTDLITWTKQDLGSTTDLGLMSVAFAGGTFVVTTNSGKIYRSTDAGVTWLQRSLSVGSLCAVTYGKGLFIATGGGFYSSPDGLTWTDRTWSLPNAFEGVTFGNNRFVAVGANSFAISQ